ncbi:hypothetical protein [Hyphomicrobium sp.]|uniref:hypothetical protein n=1 Tax=Hyphomicrobium sp. TaxID=82 RepID=UPI002C2FEE33|nr:hypothetical protein [Hyphomicrobium sp.]HRN87407.1 restriction endonuclease [Hyphomicrobium sp.]
MAKPAPVRTTGPLHFEDLEPHRFEDLVRRIVYDFRPWTQLEATGRAGSDDGFDARGFEPVLQADAASREDTSEDTEGADAEPSIERVWLIQCKREKTITPKKLGQHLDAIDPQMAGTLHGIVFAAACDFSKAARDLFRTRTRAMGVAEAYLWGRGELEDMLYQPKNDDVLFTFFGVSLRIRRQSIAADVRRRLVVKRKATRLFQARIGLDVLVRDASDERYPYPDDAAQDLEARRWSIYRYEGCHHDGLHVLRKRCFAFIDDDGRSWDLAEGMNDANPHDNPWRTEAGRRQMEAYAAARQACMPTWDDLPEQNKAWYEEFLVLPYEQVIDIDETGDEWFGGPHIYVMPFSSQRGPFHDYVRVKLATISSWDPRSAEADPAKRVQRFPRKPGPKGVSSDPP